MALERLVGTVVRGIRTPIINEGDAIEEVVVDSVLAACQSEAIDLRDQDIVTLTESIVARAQGNYATVDQIAEDVHSKFGDAPIGVVFPILSRNRFSNCLHGISQRASKVIIQLSYPADEVGNHLINLDQIDDVDINPWSDVLSEAEFYEIFGESKHPFTGLDYIQYYREIVESHGTECEIIFANNAKAILDYTDTVLACDIHSRQRTVRQLKEAGAKTVYALSDILSHPVQNSGYNESYGLLGCNKATDQSVKLFPRDCQSIVEKIQTIFKEKTGKHIEVMVYGDGAFKDPVGQIWELADPVVSPGYTAGLEGQPNEVKLKYLADNDFAELSGQEMQEAIKDYIKNKTERADENAQLGTTPRQLTDLIGSLSDLTSGSGDKGTPVILIQGYFDNYTNN